jgi:hypothetical protein
LRLAPWMRGGPGHYAPALRWLGCGAAREPPSLLPEIDRDGASGAIIEADDQRPRARRERNVLSVGVRLAALCREVEVVPAIGIAELVARGGRIGRDRLVYGSYGSVGVGVDLLDREIGHGVRGRRPVARQAKLDRDRTRELEDAPRTGRVYRWQEAAERATVRRISVNYAVRPAPVCTLPALSPALAL